MGNGGPTANVTDVESGDNSASPTESFGAYVKRLRQERGLTLRDVEKIVGGRFSNAYLSQIEHGKTKNPSVGFVVFLAAALGIDTADLMHRATHDNRPPEAPPVCPTCGRAWR